MCIPTFSVEQRLGITLEFLEMGKKPFTPYRFHSRLDVKLRTLVRFLEPLKIKRALFVSGDTECVSFVRNGKYSQNLFHS